jgi:hypothetical protein
MSATRSCTTATSSRGCRISARCSSKNSTRSPKSTARAGRVLRPWRAEVGAGRCEARNLFYLDATCPLVSKVHKQAMRHQRLGRHVLLIGHAGHPEVIGTMGQLPEGAVTLIETEEDVRNFTPADPAISASSPRRRSRWRTRPASSSALQEKLPEPGRRPPPIRSAMPPPTARTRSRKRRRAATSSRRRRAQLVQFQAPRRSRRAGRGQDVACSCSAPPRSRGNDIGDIGYARPVGRRIGARDHRRRDHRRFPRPLRRERGTRHHGDRDGALPGHARSLRDVELTSADMAFVNGKRLMAVYTDVGERMRTP